MKWYFTICHSFHGFNIQQIKIWIKNKLDYQVLVIWGLIKNILISQRNLYFCISHNFFFIQNWPKLLHVLLFIGASLLDGTGGGGGGGGTFCSSFFCWWLIKTWVWLLTEFNLFVLSHSFLLLKILFWTQPFQSKLI